MTPYLWGQLEESKYHLLDTSHVTSTVLDAVSFNKNYGKGLNSANTRNEFFSLEFIEIC
jgi:hypothetical protein